MKTEIYWSEGCEKHPSGSRVSLTQRIARMWGEPHTLAVRENLAFEASQPLLVALIFKPSSSSRLPPHHSRKGMGKGSDTLTPCIQRQRWVTTFGRKRRLGTNRMVQGGLSRRVQSIEIVKANLWTTLAATSV